MWPILIGLLSCLSFLVANSQSSQAVTPSPVIPQTTLDAVATSAPPLAGGNKFPAHQGFNYYRVCGVAATGELFRFDLDRTCPSTRDKEHSEGILLVYKLNIVPHIFKIRRYRKIITQVTVWRGLTDTAITNKFEMATRIQEWEAADFDSIYQCYNSVTMVVSNNLQTYVDRDGVNKTVNIRPVDGLTNNIQRYFSQPILYTEPGWAPGFYRVRTTVNCEIVDMLARSMEPYEYIVTALGDTLEVSPFYSNTTRPQKASLRLRVQADHKIVDYSNRGVTPTATPRVFLDTPDATYSWKSETQKDATCKLAHWKTFPRTIRTKHEHSFHFVANEVTATFTAPLVQIDNFTSTYSCIAQEINQTLLSNLGKVNTTYIQGGQPEYYQTDGNLFLVWLPLKHVELGEANKNMSQIAPPPSRRRRDTSSSTPNSVSPGGESAVVTAQIQFAYDKLTSSINDVLEELSRAWCREQLRDTLVWYELSKVNPTSVMSAIYGKPVAAKFVGDAISVTDCIYVDQESVNIHQSLRVPDQKSTCFARPRVSFKFLNSTSLLTGQLGPRKEILLSNTHIETCTPTSEHYFLVGDEIYYYKDYAFVSKLNLSEIATLDTFIALNISFIENIDFKTVELYSSSERKLASVFDIETMFREYNYYTHSLAGLKKDLDNTIDFNRDRLVQDISDMMADLGDIGKSVVNVVSSVVTVFSSIVTGFIKLFTNPVGGVVILLIIGVIIFIVIMQNRKSHAFESAPIKMLYPSVENYGNSLEGPAKPVDKDEIKRILAGMHQVHQEEQKEISERAKNRPSFLSNAVSYLRNRKSGYQRLDDSLEPEQGVEL